MSNSSRLLCHPFRNEPEPIVVSRFVLFIVGHETKHFKLFAVLNRILWRSYFNVLFKLPFDGDKFNVTLFTQLNASRCRFQFALIAVKDYMITSNATFQRY